MATEVPWTEAAFGQLLDEKLGTDWAEQLKTKWGAEWGESCAQELATKLGDNWADSPQAATDTLVELLDDTTDPVPEETTDPDGVPDVDFDQYEWLKTFTEADSFESWLVRIGMSADDATVLVNADQQSADDAGDKADVDIDRYPWLTTFAEADSFESWLVRIGMSAGDASTIVNADQQSVEEGTP